MIYEWLAEMRDAAACDDAATVAELARRIKAKIEQEQEWERESLSTFDKHHDDEGDEASDD